MGESDEGEEGCEGRIGGQFHEATCLEPGDWAVREPVPCFWQAAKRRR